MKKLLYGSASLAIFAISIIIFEISCTKDTIAQNTNYVLPPATNSTLGGIIVGNGLSITSNGTLSVNAPTSGGTQLNKIIYLQYDPAKSNEIWIMNYDGSNKTKVNITLPAGIEIHYHYPHLSPDGSKIIFQAGKETATDRDEDIYTCNLNGTNVIKVYDMPNKAGHTLVGGAY